MKKYTITFIMVLFTNIIFAQNAMEPVFKYFSGFLDETKAELAVGELMEKYFIKSVSNSNKIEINEELTKRMNEYAQLSLRKNIQYKVYVIESELADEILLPNGTLFLTSKILSYATTYYQQDFLLARNVIHMVYKHPIKMLKKSGIYPTFLKQLKMKPEDQEINKINSAIREYLVQIGLMDYTKADVECIKLTKDPEKVRLSSIEMLEKFKSSVWPAISFNQTDIPQRIKLLKELKAN